MLIGTRQLVKQGGLTAILVTNQSKGQKFTLRKGIPASLGVKLAFLTKTRVGNVVLGFLVRILFLLFFQQCRLDLVRIRKTQRQLIPMDTKLHRISHRR